jgi:hypothetical protein
MMPREKSKSASAPKTWLAMDDHHHQVTAVTSPVEPRSTTVAPFETSHQENDDHDDNSNDEAFAIDAKEMVYAVESFYAIVQPGACGVGMLL